MSSSSLQSQHELTQLQAHLEPLRQQLIEHPLYAALQTPQHLQRFTESHVYAVWDFMSLLKSLQQTLTCVQVPWLPTASANTRYLINEIVVGEESDVAPDGSRTSHFELYLRAMQQLGANTQPIQHLVDRLWGNEPVLEVINTLALPAGVQVFLQFTFELIGRGRVHEVAAVFAFGREDLIPDLFHGLVNRLHEQSSEKVSLLKYYLERHIEVDGDHHSHLASAMTMELCGSDPKRWMQAREAAAGALRSRIALWDGVLSNLEQR
ncbi:DUF3050 domain-containing protein [Larkinella insperata]|uniref:DUF3050 domain-containing protein n=1 Tax=Larkinella insperata TaxID=332158 RepID=A0ABW3QCM2_9BACT